MNLSLEFPDSEVRDVVVDGDVLRVWFSAATVRRDGRERGWLGGVTLTLSGATPPPDLAHAVGKVTEGRVSHHGRAVSPLGLPATLSGAVALELRFANGTSLAAEGTALVLAADAAAPFTDDLSC